VGKKGGVDLAGGKPRENSWKDVIGQVRRLRKKNLKDRGSGTSEGKRGPAKGGEKKGFSKSTRTR